MLNACKVPQKVRWCQTEHTCTVIEGLEPIGSSHSERKSIGLSISKKLSGAEQLSSSWDILQRLACQLSANTGHLGVCPVE
jgi:hypothetical protein